MSAAVALSPGLPTANDRFKRQSDVWIWKSIMVAVVVHFAALAFWPRMSVAVEIDEPTETRVYDLADNIPLPPPPEAIAPPVAPVVSVDPISDLATIPSNVNLRDYRDVPPPPPDASRRAEERYERWVPSMVAPRLLNQQEIERALERFYPAFLRDAGIGGSVGVLFWLDEEGRVVQARVAESSGIPQLDEAALRVADQMRLSPALNRDRPVRVMVTIPIRFSTH